MIFFSFVLSIDLPVGLHAILNHYKIYIRNNKILQVFNSYSRLLLSQSLMNHHYSELLIFQDLLHISQVYKVNQLFEIMEKQFHQNQEQNIPYAFNPYLPSGLVHPYQLDESISIFRCG